MWVHASIGTVCMVSGLVALAAKKQPGRHPLAGRVFSISLALLFLAILPNLVAKTNVFLFGIGGLAIYTSIEGWRALLRYLGRLDPGPDILDYSLNGLCALSSIGLVGYGGWAFSRTGNALGLVCVGFGILGVVLVKAAWHRWKTPPSANGWLAIHIGMMMGAFSAAVTAFVAIQFSGKVGNLEWVIWVAPSVVMSVLSKREVKRRGLQSQP